jgi:hypothetical protein
MGSALALPKSVLLLACVGNQQSELKPSIGSREFAIYFPQPQLTTLAVKAFGGVNAFRLKKARALGPTLHRVVLMFLRPRHYRDFAKRT